MKILRLKWVGSKRSRILGEITWVGYKGEIKGVGWKKWKGKA